MNVNSVNYFDVGAEVAHVDSPHVRLDVQRVDIWVLRGCRTVRYGLTDPSGGRHVLDSSQVTLWVKFKVGDLVEIKSSNETHRGVVAGSPYKGIYDVRRDDGLVVAYWQEELTLAVDFVSPHHFQD